MARIKNFIHLMGVIMKIPNSTKTANGRKKLSFIVCSLDIYRDSKGVKRKGEHYHQVIAWGKLADLIEKHGRKGQVILLTGMLVFSGDGEDDNTIAFTNAIVLSEFLLMKGGEADLPDIDIPV